jgi:hypothetical protein
LSNLLIILLKRSKILTGLAKLAFLHTLTHVPVHESTLAIHEVKLVIQAGPSLGNGRGVGKHRDGAVDRGETAICGGSRRDGNRLLVVDADLEAGGAPLDKVERRLRLECSNGGAAVAVDDVTAVEEGDGHVFALAGVANDHLVVRLKALEGQVRYLEALMSTLGSTNDRSIADKRVVNAGIGNQVGLELVQINVESTVEAEGGGDGGNDLGDQAVQVFVAWPGNVQIPAADVVHSFVINQEGAVRVLDSAVGAKNSVVGLHDGSRNTGCRVNGELKLALLGIIGRETLQEESAKARAGTSTERMEDQETLEGAAVINNPADAIDDRVDHLLANGVVTTSVVVGSILLATDQSLGVEKLSVVSSADLIDRGRVKIDEEGSGDVFSVVGLSEKGIEGATLSNGGIRIGATVRSETMLKEVQLPSAVTQLGTSLAQVKMENLASHLD